VRVLNVTPPIVPPIVRLLVREMSGLWWVDQGLMLRSTAEEHRTGWNRMGFMTLMLKCGVWDRSRCCRLPIVPRPNVRWTGGNPHW
jgi:hypothetical protein